MSNGEANFENAGGDNEGQSAEQNDPAQGQEDGAALRDGEKIPGGGAYGHERQRALAEIKASILEKGGVGAGGATPDQAKAATAAAEVAKKLEANNVPNGGGGIFWKSLSKSFKFIGKLFEVGFALSFAMVISLFKPKSGGKKKGGGGGHSGGGGGGGGHSSGGGGGHKQEHAKEHHAPDHGAHKPDGGGGHGGKSDSHGGGGHSGGGHHH